MIAELHTTTRQNARTWGNRFSSRFLESGIVSYEDNGGDKELLTHETINRYAQTFVGRPVIVRHSKVTPETMEGKAVGYISRVWFEPSDGWFYCEGIITNDDAKALVRNGWSVSCSYRVTDTDESRGNYHNIPYVRELTAFEGEHLALVENPRYEGATIRLNSKNTKSMNVFKLFKKLFVAPTEVKADDPNNATTEEGTRTNAAPAAPVAEEVSVDSEIDVGDGKKVTLRALVDRYNAAPDMPTPGKKENDKGDLDDKLSRKENESDEDFEKRKNEFEKAKKDKEEKDKKDNHCAPDVYGKSETKSQYNDNAKKDERDNQSFQTLQKAATTPYAILDRANSAETEADQLARGRERYGSRHGKN